MSYFDNPPEFLGEMPLPELVGDSDPGILALKANADHSHGLTVEAWQNVLFAGGWNWFGGTTRIPEYTRIGNVAVLRGVFANAVGQNPGSIMGSIPVDYCPSGGQRETFPIWNGSSGGQMDIQANGNIVYAAGAAGVTFVVFGTIMWVID